MDYIEFKSKFDAEHDTFPIPNDCSEPRDPFFRHFTLYSWSLEWHLMFTDNTYIRIWEDYCRVKGLQESYRKRSAFHYGPVPKLDQDGLPDYKPSDPVSIRIDNCMQGYHLHFGKPEPHIPQSQIQKLDLSKLDLFTFARGIIKHRTSGQSLEKILGFRVT